VILVEGGRLGGSIDSPKYCQGFHMAPLLLFQAQEDKRKRGATVNDDQRDVRGAGVVT
jgi:hypothetical protein